MLSKNAYKILKLFDEKYSLSNDEIKNLPEDAFSTLERDGYIKQDSLGYPDGYRAQYSDYHITDKGKSYVQSKSRSEWLANNWIQFLSMIFALIAAIPVIKQGLEIILKCIT